MDKGALGIYRDLLRLAEHVGGQGPKGTKIKSIVRAEFRKGRLERDPEKVQAMLERARTALTNYLLMDNLAKAGKLPRGAAGMVRPGAIPDLMSATAGRPPQPPPAPGAAGPTK